MIEGDGGAPLVFVGSSLADELLVELANPSALRFLTWDERGAWVVGWALAAINLASCPIAGHPDSLGQDHQKSNCTALLSEK